MNSERISAKMLRIFYGQREADCEFFGLDAEYWDIEIRGDKDGFLVIYRRDYYGNSCHSFRADSLTDIRPTPAEMEER